MDRVLVLAAVEEGKGEGEGGTEGERAGQGGQEVIRCFLFFFPFIAYFNRY